MTANWRRSCWKLGIAISLLAGGAIASSENSALAQITPDGTLGNESSIVTPNVIINNVSVDRIDGGLRRGTNLFHSFQEFNIGEGRGAYFANPIGVENIFSRVTGGNPSLLFGRLGVLGNANLFFLNPNGIIFGPRASLDIRGSFVASTASSLLFPNGTFSAQNPEPSSLLTINVAAPVGLQFERTSGDISVRGSYLEVDPQKTLALIGGKVTLEERGGLLAPGGRVELGGVTGRGRVDLNVVGNNLNLSFPSDLALADIVLSNIAFVNVSANTSGSIAINSGNFSVSGGSFISSNTGDGKGGDISVNAESVSLSTGGVIEANTLGNGQGGNLSINADSVELQGTTGALFSGLLAQTIGAGAGGNVTITTRNLRVSDGAAVLVGSTLSGSGGNLTVKDAALIELTGESTDGQFGSGLYVTTVGAGNAGNLSILNAGQLIIRNGAQVSAATTNTGRGGDVTLQADSIQVIGFVVS